MSAADLKAKQGEREAHERGGGLEARIPVSSSMCRFWLTEDGMGRKGGRKK